MMGEVSPETSPKNTMIQDMINSETIWIQLNRQTQTYSRLISFAVYLCDYLPHLRNPTIEDFMNIVNIAIADGRSTLIRCHYQLCNKILTKVQYVLIRK